MTDPELDKEMSDLNTSGNGEVTITEFLDYFERHRENGGGLIAKYIAQKKKREEPDWQAMLATGGGGAIRTPLSIFYMDHHE